MFPAMIDTCTRTILIVFMITFVNGQDRKITSQNHPGCHVCTDSDTLIYTRAEGSHDTIHLIWDFTGGVPTVILSVASVHSTMNILWDGSTPREFNMSETPKYSFATAFDMLYEYSDVHDNGYIEWDSKRVGVSLAHVSWQLMDDIQTEDEVMVQMRGKIAHRDTTGIIEVRMDLLPFQDYAVQLPHLIHTANSTLVDVSLVNLTTTPGWNQSRFALRAALLSTDARDDSMRYDMRQSLDDEHTPGVFEIIEIKSPESARGGDGGYLQFRPVAYTQRARGVESSTIVRVSGFNRTDIRTSTIDTFFRENNRDRLLIQDMLVSFGETGDGYYVKHNYTGWSLTVGYGSPPLEGFSTFVIAVICVGLGAPLLLGAIAGLVCCARRRRDPAHARLQDH